MSAIKPFKPSPLSANADTEHVADSVIEYLRSIPDFAGYGSDGGLQSAWDEVCLQQQTDRWDTWRMYEELIEGYALTALEAVPLEVQIRISQEYISGLYEADDFDGNDVFLEGGAEHILNFILKRAKNEDNKNVDNYLNGTPDSEEADDDYDE